LRRSEDEKDTPKGVSEEVMKDRFRVQGARCKGRKRMGRLELPTYELSAMSSPLHSSLITHHSSFPPLPLSAMSYQL
jgi:hypothetical protein